MYYYSWAACVQAQSLHRKENACCMAELHLLAKGRHVDHATPVTHAAASSCDFAICPVPVLGPENSPCQKQFNLNRGGPNSGAARRAQQQGRKNAAVALGFGWFSQHAICKILGRNAGLQPAHTAALLPQLGAPPRATLQGSRCQADKPCCAARQKANVRHSVLKPKAVLFATLVWARECRQNNLAGPAWRAPDDKEAWGGACLSTEEFGLQTCGHQGQQAAPCADGGARPSPFKTSGRWGLAVGFASDPLSPAVLDIFNLFRQLEQMEELFKKWVDASLRLSDDVHRR